MKRFDQCLISIIMSFAIDIDAKDFLVIVMNTFS